MADIKFYTDFPDTSVPDNADNANNNFNELNEKINDIKGKVLWQNSDPTSSFPSQTITLDSNVNNFDSYSILYKYFKFDNQLLNSGIIPKTFGTKLNASYEFACVREVYAPTGTSLTFLNGKKMSAIGSTIDDNDRCVPYQIIGYK